MIERIAQAALTRWTTALIEAAADELPEGFTAEPAAGGLRLTGPGLARRWMSDIALRAFALAAARRRG